MQAFMQAFSTYRNSSVPATVNAGVKARVDAGVSAVINADVNGGVDAGDRSLKPLHNTWKTQMCNRHSYLHVKHKHPL